MQSADILIVEHRSLFRRGLRKRLGDGGHRVLAQVDSGAEALRLMEGIRPDVVMMAHDLPDADGVSVCREIRAIGYETKVLLIVLDEVDSDEDFHLTALLAGAVGCVRRTIPAERWLQAVDYVLRGGALFQMGAIRRALQQGAQIGQFNIDDVTDPTTLSAANEIYRLLVVEVPSLFRTGLVACLEGGGYHAVREASSADQAMDILVDWPAELVIAGVELPGINGFALAREIREVYPNTTVLLTGWRVEDKDVQIRACQAGAVGCVSKYLSEDEFVTIITGALSGKTFFPDHDESELGYRSLFDEAGEPLTPREEDVIELIAAGQTNKQIAETLRISERTVDKHVRSILGKLNVSSRTEAAVLWVQRTPIVTAD